MPNRPKTPQHSIRVPNDEWQAVVAAAEKNGETVTDVARRAFRAYVKRAVKS